MVDLILSRSLVHFFPPSSQSRQEQAEASSAPEHTMDDEDPYDFDEFVRTEERGPSATAVAGNGNKRKASKARERSAAGRSGRRKVSSPVIHAVEDSSPTEEMRDPKRGTGSSPTTSYAPAVRTSPRKPKPPPPVIDIDSLLSEDEEEEDSKSVLEIAKEENSPETRKRSSPLPSKRRAKDADGEGKKKKKRRVTFADASALKEVKFYEPDPASQTKDDADKGADAIEWGDEVEFALDGLRCARQVKVALRSAHQLASLCSSSSHQTFLKEDPDIRESFLEGAAAMAARDSSEPGSAAFALYASVVLYNVIVRGKMRLTTAEMPSVLTTVHNLLRSGLRCLLPPPVGGESGGGRGRARAGDNGAPSPASAFVRSYAKLKSISKALTIDRDLPAFAQDEALPLMVALLLLCAKIKAPETIEDSNEYEEMKKRLVETKVLDDLNRILVACDPSGGDPRHSLEIGSQQGEVQRCWILDRALKVMASATFLNHQNVRHIERSPSGRPHANSSPAQGKGKRTQRGETGENGDGSQGERMASFLLGMVEAQYGAKTPALRACLNSSLNLLLNLTHESRQSCEILRSSTDFSRLAGIVADYHYCSAKGGGEGGLGDLVNLVLGLLINMAEKDEGTGAKLCALPMSAFCDEKRLEAAGSWIKSGRRDFLDFIFVVSDLSDAGGKVADHGDEAGAPVTSEVTVEMLNGSSASSGAGAAGGGGRGSKSISQTYAAILLAFLVADDASLRKNIARLLPGCTLAPLIERIKDFLSFLSSANALTDKQKDVLTDLVSRLRS